MSERCLQDLQVLYDEIMAAMQGGAVTSVGTGGRSTSYSPAKLKEQISIYRQLYASCGADSDLPELQDPDVSTAKRGAPFVARFGR